MKCFYHRDTDAVGLCRHCARALCAACAAERETGLACINRCEGEVDRVAALIKRNVRVSNESFSVALRSAVFVAGSIVLAYLGYTSYEREFRILFFVLTALMLVLAISGLRYLMIQQRR